MFIGVSFRLTCCSVGRGTVGPRSRSRRATRPLKTFTSVHSSSPITHHSATTLQCAGHPRRRDVTIIGEGVARRAGGRVEEGGRCGVAPRHRPAGRNDADPHPCVDAVANRRTCALLVPAAVDARTPHTIITVNCIRQSALRVERMYATKYKCIARLNVVFVSCVSEEPFHGVCPAIYVQYYYNRIDHRDDLCVAAGSAV